jgi:hypothetical protein
VRRRIPRPLLSIQANHRKDRMKGPATSGFPPNVANPVFGRRHQATIPIVGHKTPRPQSAKASKHQSVNASKRQSAHAPARASFWPEVPARDYGAPSHDGPIERFARWPSLILAEGFTMPCSSSLQVALIECFRSRDIPENEQAGSWSGPAARGFEGWEPLVDSPSRERPRLIVSGEWRARAKRSELGRLGAVMTRVC